MPEAVPDVIDVSYEALVRGRAEEGRCAVALRRQRHLPMRAPGSVGGAGVEMCDGQK